MSDQTAPPEAAAPEAPGMPPEIQQIHHISAETQKALEQAIVRCAGVAGAAEAPAEMDQAASAALKLAQALVILDPALVAPQGIPAIAMFPPKPRIPFDPAAPGPPTVGR